MGKRRRKAWLSDGDQARAKTLGRRELGLCLFLATETDVVNTSAKARQHRCRIDGGLCATELVDQSAERHRADILAPDQPEPYDGDGSYSPTP